MVILCLKASADVAPITRSLKGWQGWMWDNIVSR
jgi:hypothetical protein